ncbi:hypothetical protein BJY00DRAFT_314938, partial [Aspergillus carlsbadensis]
MAQRQMPPVYAGSSGSTASTTTTTTTTKCPTSPPPTRTRHQQRQHQSTPGPVVGSDSPAKEPGSDNHLLLPEKISGFDLPDGFNDNDLLFFSSLYTRGRSQSTDDILCFSPESSSTSNTLVSPTEAFCAAGSGASGKDKGVECLGSEYGHTSKITKRQAQNREAQRRFRERREQERSHLLDLLQKVTAENSRVTAMLEQTRARYVALEARTEQLQTEAGILRRWRAEMMESVAGLVLQKDEPGLEREREQVQVAEEVLGAVVVGSCSGE